MNSELEYYSIPGHITNLSNHAKIINEITDNPEYICQIY